MDQWQTDKVCQPLNPSQSSQLDSRQRPEAEVKDPVAVRKVQKADREKLRRDRLNDQFQELGSALDPERPKNDKATILTDAIQILRDLTAEVNKLKAECATLSEESHELTQEKNELREEKASLKSDIENLNAQYQQRLRVVYPWGAIESSVVMGPPYSYSLPMAVPPGSIPMHPSLQPYPFFGSQNASTIPSPRPTFMPYPTPPNPHVEQQPIQPAPTSHVLSKPSKSSDSGKARHLERTDDSSDVTTELELKMPGCGQQQESGDRKGKHSQKKEKSATDGGSPSRFSSSQVPQESSSNSVSHVPKSDK
ncbi:transcription factor bHLH121-like [Chenopodium quinoa]|uniref:transcription factor bHLH121-like n=1 Tax=Chenopodium quinoa TaxID=63459 RepID=UPI000B78DD91|nr:transcription factor bHLH121-like [Chenopodium quinoa]